MCVCVYLSMKFKFNMRCVSLFGIREKTGWQRGQHVALQS